MAKWHGLAALLTCGITVALSQTTHVQSCTQAAVRLTQLEGSIVARSGEGEPCAWEIVIEEPVKQIHFNGVHGAGRFGNSDRLLFYSAGDLLAVFTKQNPLPEWMTLLGDVDVQIIFEGSSPGTSIQLMYYAESKGFVSIFGDYFHPIVVACGSVVGVMVCILVCVCVYLVRAYLETKRELLRSVQESNVIPYQRRRIEEGVRQAMEQELQTQSALTQLPSRGYVSDDPEQAKETECSLCLETFQEGEQVRILRCRHMFHKACVDEWFSKQRFRARTCPLCRGQALEQAALAQQAEPSSASAVVIGDRGSTSQDNDDDGDADVMHVSL